MLNWYVIQTKPKKETVAASHLELESVEVFFPKMKSVSMVFGRARTVTTSLFPGYIFARFDPYVSYRLVKWSQGVSRVVGFEGGPLPIADEAIEIIKRRADKDSIVRKALLLKAKDPIRIRSGPLKDLLGVFEHWVSGKERVSVLLNLLTYSATAELHYSQVEKIT